MYEKIRKAASSLGFAKVFFLRPERLERWRMEAERAAERLSLRFDIKASYPSASCILLLVCPYAPFSADERISAYYLASQRGYLAAKSLAAAIAEQGHYCELAAAPARALALLNGIGTAGKNGLLRLPRFGSRIALYTLATDACAPQAEPCPDEPCPGGCDACMRACPMDAIYPDGLHVERCMRRFMDGAEYPEEVYAAQRTHMGCEVCQHACPKNAGLAAASPPAEAQDAFSLPRLIRGDVAAARALVGRNKTGNGKLTAEAIRFAARQGLYAEEIRRAGAESQFPAVKNAAEWVFTHYFIKK